MHRCPAPSHQGSQSREPGGGPWQHRVGRTLTLTPLGRPSSSIRRGPLATQEADPSKRKSKTPQQRHPMTAQLYTHTHTLMLVHTHTQPPAQTTTPQAWPPDMRTVVQPISQAATPMPWHHSHPTIDRSRGLTALPIVQHKISKTHNPNRLNST